jgi:hypothetical protein
MYEAKDALVVEKRVVELLVRAAVANQLGYTESIEQMQRKALLSAKMIATGDIGGGGGGDVINNSYSHSNGDLEINQQQIHAAERSVERSLSSLSPDERIALLRRANPKLKVLWGDFLRTLLDFQLEGHDAFLSKFRSLFRQYDPERRGVVSTSAFLQMAANVAISSTSASSTSSSVNGPSRQEDSSGAAVVGPEAAARLAVLADPGNVGQVTFSKAVAVLCKEAGVTNAGSSNSNTKQIIPTIASHSVHIPAASGASSLSLRSAQQQQQQQQQQQAQQHQQAPQKHQQPPPPPPPLPPQIRSTNSSSSSSLKTDAAQRSARNMLFT